jgi:hypothetical protein
MEVRTMIICRDRDGDTSTDMSMEGQSELRI